MRAMRFRNAECATRSMASAARSSGSARRNARSTSRTAAYRRTSAARRVGSSFLNRPSSSACNTADGPTCASFRSWTVAQRSFIGRVMLLHNEKNGTFKDATATAKIETNGLNAGLTFIDYDHDGDLDLYVGRFPKDLITQRPVGHSMVIETRFPAPHPA